MPAAKSSRKTQSECFDLSSNLTPEERERLGKAQAADAKQPQPSGKPKSPPDRKSESAAGKSRSDAQSGAGWVDLTPSSTKQRLARADAKQPQPPGTSKSPPDRKSESNSEITPALQDLIDNKPDHETAEPVKIKFLERCHSFIGRGSHECLRAAWEAGFILAAIREKLPHGNSKEAREGGEQTWPGWVEEKCKFCIETANHWADIWTYVKPETVDIPWHEVTYEIARELARSRKETKANEVVRRGSKAKKGGSNDKNADPKKSQNKRPPPPLGNAVRAVKNAALKLPHSVKAYSIPRDSRTRETDTLAAHVDDCLQACEIILKSVTDIGQLTRSFLGSLDAKSQKRLALLTDIASAFSKKHDAFMKIAPKEVPDVA